jgi:ABC-type sugar transport system substrate-binding protein
MRKMKSRKSAAVVGALASTVVLLLSSCSSSSTSNGTNASSAGGGPSGSASAKSGGTPAQADGTVSVPVGGGKTIKVTKSLSIAFVSAGLGNPYGLEQATAAKKQAAAIGAKIKVFDGNFNPQTQYSILQTVVSSHSYNAVIVVPIDANLLCSILTKAAPAAGIMVATVSSPICNTALLDDEQSYAPTGVFTVIRPLASYLTYKYYVEQAVKAVPGPQKVIAINGLPLATNTAAFTKALNFEKAQNKDFDVVANVNLGAYTYQDALSKIQAALQAHQDATLIMTSLGDAARAAVDTLKQRGKSGQIKIVDADAGTKSSMANIAAGNVEFALANFPGPDFTVAINAFQQALDSKSVPRVIDSSQGTIKSDANGEMTLVTKANAAQYAKYAYAG